MKVLIYTSIVSFIGIFVLLGYWSYPWNLKEKKITGPVVKFFEASEDKENSHVLKVLTWNLGFLYGEGSQGPGYESQAKAFYENKLSKLVEEIKKADVDVVFLQEVDFDSARSHHINQAEFVAKNAGFAYVAEASSWELNYIPFPYWPLSRHFGRMKSGGAVLSKYPILKNEIHLLKKPEAHPWWYNIFYLHRYFQKVEIEIDERLYHFINLHLESFNQKNRMEQATSLVQLINKESIDLVAGDFNMLPSVATKTSNFLNSTDNYNEDNSYEIVSRSGLKEIIPNEIYDKDEATYFTFPSSRPSRRLDYIWYKSDYKMIKAEVLNSALSDHLPLRAVLQIRVPEFNQYLR